ncbi:hypothetical protein GH714_010382 [Hevea brasiliensis]|uniref:Uncharacterized protein n=1 Tax=Hevea brasiliensis TaxID=3981 RepID=A0A6A6MVA2_HEVBR|nr:hypothetical protein GH714_010382 [Hevea brasiliensis]
MKLGREAAECISGNFIKAKALGPHDDEDEDSNDDYSDEEESQSPIDKVKMKIITKETTMVYPMQDTPSERLWLSNLDLMQGRTHLPSAYLYKPNGSSNFFEPKVLKEALSKVLVPFYPVAGRLGSDDNGRIEINCNKEGVLFAEAETYLPWIMKLVTSCPVMYCDNSFLKSTIQVGYLLFHYLFYRSRFSPPLPPGFFGNVVFFATPIALCGELRAESLMETVERVHKAIKKMEDKYLRSAIDFLEGVGDLTKVTQSPKTSQCPNLKIISWTRMPFYEADFGWGQPTIMRASNPWEGKAHVLSCPSSDGSLLLPICLQTHHMAAFQRLFYDFS